METSQVSFSAKDVMALRQKTGLGMMACKKALTETGGDMEAAEQLLREQMKGKMESRTERATGEGRIGIAVDGTRAAIVEVRTETDFTARNEAFVKTVDVGLFHRDCLIRCPGRLQLGGHSRRRSENLSVKRPKAIR